MAKVNNPGGQRGNLSSNTGRKERSPTSHGQTGSRADPSHTNDQNKNDKAKKSPDVAAKASGKDTSSKDTSGKNTSGKDKSTDQATKSGTKGS